MDTKGKHLSFVSVVSIVVIQRRVIGTGDAYTAMPMFSVAV